MVLPPKPEGTPVMTRRMYVRRMLQVNTDDVTFRTAPDLTAASRLLPTVEAVCREVRTRLTEP